MENLAGYPKLMRLPIEKFLSMTEYKIDRKVRVMEKKKLQCDICGGNLIMQAGGELAKCDSCGMEFSKERLCEKVQEIKGTVKVEGAVETVRGDAEKERLLKNAETYTNLNDFEEAKIIYLEIIKEYPDDYRGWWGIFIISSNNMIENLKDGKGERDYDYVRFDEVREDYEKSISEWLGERYAQNAFVLCGDKISILKNEYNNRWKFICNLIRSRTENNDECFRLIKEKYAINILGESHPLIPLIREGKENAQKFVSILSTIPEPVMGVFISELRFIQNEKLLSEYPYGYGLSLKDALSELNNALFYLGNYIFTIDHDQEYGNSLSIWHVTYPVSKVEELIEYSIDKAQKIRIDRKAKRLCPRCGNPTGFFGGCEYCRGTYTNYKSTNGHIIDKF